MARARHAELNAVRNETADLREALEARKVIERAKGLLMEKDGLPESEAFARLRSASQATGKPLREVAEAVCAAFEGGSTTSPWVASDQADYAPASTVTLTGGNWAPGETVHLFVDDTNGHTWNHSDDVTADDSGAIQDVFNLPDMWVSNYDVTA